MSGAEATPRREGIATAAQAKGPGKVVSAARWNNQHRQPKLYQLRQMAMDSAIAAEEKDHVGLVGGIGQTDAPVDCFPSLKRFEVLGSTAQAEDGCGAHRR